ncbi:MAG: DUF3857 domain-containing transglutaminase family protein [Bryobacteraceae bacterium]|nr:DUF3857 domain-containing transglutaminase family protein [Bryobacteraceae bacterium]
MSYSSPVATALALIVSLTPLFAVDWLPVDASLRALQVPKIESDADAEVLYWDFRVKDVFQGQDFWVVYDTYRRIKIFTDKGVKEYSTVELPSGPRISVSDVSARTIKPDGTIVELKKEDIVERDIVKVGRKKYRARVINFPGVEKGTVVEYRFSEVRMRQLSTNLRIPFQLEIPVHRLKVSIKPLQVDWMRYGMRSYAFNTKVPALAVTDNSGYASFTLEDRKSFRREPFMAPEYQLREWMLIFYEEDKKLTPDKFWKEYGKDVYREFRVELKTDGAMKQAAASATEGLTTEADKANALYRWVRANIRNVYSLGSGVTAEQRQKFKENKTPSDTLKQKLGTANDIALVFASLCLSAGLEPRLTKSSDRGFRFFEPAYMARAMAPTENIAVRAGTSWLFFDPSSDHLAPGMLSWREEGIRTLVSDPKEPQIVEAPMLKPEQSVASRRADVTIAEDGSATAKVVLSYTGHQARERRLQIDEDTEAERIQNETEEMQKRFGGAEVSGMKIENVADVEKPLTYSFQLKMPVYATRTGKRLFVQPAFFQAQIPARFPENKRTHPIFFNYAWQEIDEVTLHLPEGLELDQPTAPEAFTFGPVGEYKTELRKSNDGHLLAYRRELIFGRDGVIGFAVDSYPLLKRAFDAVYQQDNHTVTLKAAK